VQVWQLWQQLTNTNQSMVMDTLPQSRQLETKESRITANKKFFQPPRLACATLAATAKNWTRQLQLFGFGFVSALTLHFGRLALSSNAHLFVLTRHHAFPFLVQSLATFFAILLDPKPPLRILLLIRLFGPHPIVSGQQAEWHTADSIANPDFAMHSPDRVLHFPSHHTLAVP